MSFIKDISLIVLIIVFITGYTFAGLIILLIRQFAGVSSRMIYFTTITLQN
jgi:hypothetical protein